LVSPLIPRSVCQVVSVVSLALGGACFAMSRTLMTNPDVMVDHKSGKMPWDGRNADVAAIFKK